jgi:hypothetical protein
MGLVTGGQYAARAKNVARRRRSGPKLGAYRVPSFGVGARCAIVASIAILFPSLEHIVVAERVRVEPPTVVTLSWIRPASVEVTTIARDLR